MAETGGGQASEWLDEELPNLPAADPPRLWHHCARQPGQHLPPHRHSIVEEAAFELRGTLSSSELGRHPLG